VPVAPPLPRNNVRAEVAVRLAGLWVLAGGLFKLFLGTPADLPAIVKDLPLGFDLPLRLKLVVAAELSVAVLAVLRPRLAWLLLTVLLLVFGGVLTSQVVGGASSCGCFGTKVQIPPAVALAVDGGLLLLLLSSRPWTGRVSAAPPWIVGLALAAAIALPFVLDREASEPGESGYVLLDVESWVGRDIHETKLAALIDVDALPLDGLWVLYRDTCEVCARHLERLSVEEWGVREVVLLKMPDAPGGEKHVRAKPKGPHVHEVVLPERPEPSLTPPADLVLEKGRVVSAREALTH
jgi:hypothetical protein